MYELITQNEADRIKQILTECILKKNINIEVLKGKYKINVSSITQTDKSQRYTNDMSEFYLLNSDGKKGVLSNKNRVYEVFMDIGDWGYKTRLHNVHITIGSPKSGDYSFQLELSQAIEDEENLYIVKNITDLSGNGALVRLYRGLGHDKVKKEIRKEEFQKEFGGPILKYQGKEWIVISKIPLKKLFDDKEKEDILYTLLNSILKAMILVEGIGEEIV